VEGLVTYGVPGDGFEAQGIYSLSTSPYDFLTKHLPAFEKHGEGPPFFVYTEEYCN